MGYAASVVVLVIALAGGTLGIAASIVAMGVVVAAKVAVDLVVDGDQPMAESE